MPGLDPEVAKHHLGVPPDAKPTKQKRQTPAKELMEPVTQEVRKLMDVGVIQEV